MTARFSTRTNGSRVGGKRGGSGFRLVGLALVLVLGILAFGWLALWIRDVLDVRTSAQAARDLIAAGRYDQAGVFLK